MKKRTFERCPNCECGIGFELNKAWNGEDNKFIFTCPDCKIIMEVIVDNTPEFYCEIEKLECKK